jgi:hypothetical protein
LFRAGWKENLIASKYFPLMVITDIQPFSGDVCFVPVDIREMKESAN